MFDEEGPIPKPVITLRPYQVEWCDKIEADRAKFNRVLLVASGGMGKSTVSAELARRAWMRGQRTLILENRDRIVDQIAEEVRKASGLEVDVERGADHASPYAPIVVASVQTLSRLNRLTGFAPDHFGQIIADEAHINSISPTPLRVLRYFHWGGESLTEDWKQPDDLFPVKSYLIGTTATPDLGAKRTLGELYQHISVNYSFRQAVAEGWLCGPRAYRKALPSAKKLHARYGNTPLGKDLRADDLSSELIPLISEMTDQLDEFAPDCKTIAFVPSVECARLLAESCCQRGYNAWFVSGECLDKDEKTNAFEQSGKRSILVNACLYVQAYDHPPIDCVAWFRPTTSRAFLLQGLFRGSRVLKGILKDGMDTEARLAAIASSAKPYFRIIDPLWRSEEIPLCSFYDLWSAVPEVKERLAELPEGADLGAEAEKKERDWAASLEKAAKKQKERQAQIGVDPLAWATSIGEDRIANYTPTNAKDAGPIAPEQEEFFVKVGIKYGHVTCYGQAAELISTYLTRKNEGLASPKSIRQLVLRLGWPESEAAAMNQRKAGMLIAKGVRYKRPATLDEDDPALAWGDG